MKKEETLVRNLPEMIRETQIGRLNWRVQVQTTEYNTIEEKPRVVEEDGSEWIVDECYVCYETKYREQDFLMITYEMIHTHDDKVKSTNLVFLPPMGIRYFDIHTLLPYSIEASQMITYQAHMLWEAILEQSKKKPEQIQMDVSTRVLTIEDE